jgi:hypothetical protein
MEQKISRIVDTYFLIGKNFRHRKTETVYHVTSLAYNETTLEPLVIYHDANLVYWARPLSEFVDGRFIRV